jgi:hypothetical protein
VHEVGTPMHVVKRESAPSLKFLHVGSQPFLSFGSPDMIKMMLKSLTFISVFRQNLAQNLTLPDLRAGTHCCASHRDTSSALPSADPFPETCQRTEQVRFDAQRHRRADRFS